MENEKSAATLLGFLMFIFGMLSLILSSMVGVKLQFMLPIDNLGSLGGRPALNC